MASQRPIPQWRLPAGVTRGLWEYAQADHIADDYDSYFQNNSLFDFDLAVLERNFTRPGLLADLGCGTGRLLVPFARRGFRGLAIDLSARMLQVVRQKAESQHLDIQPLLANMTELDCLADDSLDYAICMFSTLGMIRGRENRERALRHIQRTLKPRGLFALHVHNRWYSLFDPLGRVWLMKNTLSSLIRRDVQRGDKFFDYRGIPNMFLHVWTRSELRRDLNAAGFQIRQMIALDTARRHALPKPWLLGRLRANGWIVICENRQ